MALGAAVLASRALAAPTPARALLAISAAPYGQWCPSRVLPLREQVAPMPWGTALPEPGNVPACRTCQWLSWPVATVLQQWTCQGLGYTREGKDSSGKGVVKPNTMVGPWRGFSSAGAMVQLSHGTHPRMGPHYRYQPLPSCHILQHPSTRTEASWEEQWGS